MVTTLTGLQAVPRRKLVDEVLDQLQRLISSDAYKSGDRIPSEPELMKLLAVGRSTVREAVKILVHAGKLEVRQGDGTYIQYSELGTDQVKQTLTKRNYPHIVEVRSILEVEISGLAAERRTDADLARMRTYLDQRNEALDRGQYVDYVEADINYHLAIATASHNEVLLEMYAIIANTLKVMLSQLILDTQSYDDNTRLHEAIYEAIAAKDSVNARQRTHDNLHSATRESF